MNHNFIPSIHNGTICAKCRQSQIAHSDLAECEACGSVGPCDLMYGSLLLCESCALKEKELQTQNSKPEIVQARVDSMNQALAESRSIDSSISVRSDLFNASTVAIVELKKSIDENQSIENKNYTLAEELMKRFQLHKTTIFEANETIMKASNEQKAIQVYLNNLANQLRTEEREKLKIADINYQPSKPKVTKPTVIKTSKPKLDKVTLRKYASELGISEFMLQQIVVSKGVSVEDAASIIKASIEAAKSKV